MELVTLEQAANILGVATRTVRRRADEGNLTVYKSGHLIRFDVNEVKNLWKPVATDQSEKENQQEDQPVTNVNLEPFIDSLDALLRPNRAKSRSVPSYASRTELRALANVVMQIPKQFIVAPNADHGSFEIKRGRMTSEQCDAWIDANYGSAVAAILMVAPLSGNKNKIRPSVWAAAAWLMITTWEDCLEWDKEKIKEMSETQYVDYLQNVSKANNDRKLYFGSFVELIVYGKSDSGIIEILNHTLSQAKDQKIKIRDDDALSVIFHAMDAASEDIRKCMESYGSPTNVLPNNNNNNQKVGPS